MSSKTQSILIPIMLAGAILGGIAGYFIPEFMLSVSVIGQLFLNLLKIITLPLIISVIIVGIASLGDTRKIGRTTIASVLYFLSTSAVAVIIGIILVSLIEPGLYSSASETIGRTGVPDIVSYAKSFKFADIFGAFIPSNIINSTTGGQYLGIVVLSLIFGTVAATMGKKAKVVLDFFNVISEVSLKAVYGILFIAPVGLFFLVGSAVAENPNFNFGIKISFLMVTLLAGIIIHGLIILPVILKIFGRKSPHSFAGNMSSALATALGTSSSIATMPVTYSCVVEKNKIDNRASSLVIPLGSYVNLNGTAMFMAIMTIFACQMYGVSLSILNIMLIGLMSIILSFCSAGVPGSSIFMMAILFSIMNLPNEAYAALGLLAAVDWLFDRGRTVLNVWGNAVGAAVIGERFDFKTVSKIKSSTPPKKYERTYGRKTSYSREKSDKQDRPKYAKKTRETKATRTAKDTRDIKERKKPIAKKNEKVNATKTKPKPVKKKKEIIESKKQTKPLVDRKKVEVKPVRKQTSTLKPPAIPPAKKRDASTTENVTEKKSRSKRTTSDQNEIEFINNPSNETIERERAKIAAQLASMKVQEHSGSNIEDKPEPITKSKEMETDNHELSVPTIDFYSDDDQVEKEKPAKEKESFFSNNNILDKVESLTIPDSLGESIIEDEPDLEPEAEIEKEKETEAETQLVIEPDIKISKPEKVVEKIEPKIVVPEIKPVIKAKPEQPSQVSAEESELELEKAPEPEAKKEPEKAIEETPEPQFGRTKTRRGGAKKPDSDGDDKSNDAPVPTTSSVTVVEDEENISFGRTKRKKTPK